MFYLKLGVIFALIFIILDSLWLGLVMHQFYNQELGVLARRSGGQLALHWPSIVLAYILLIIGPVMFVLPKFLGGPIGLALFLSGALFGLIIYGTYNLTNYAVLVHWPLKLVIIDVLWGTFLYGIASWATGYFARHLDML